jgi:uncharacterized damage-inducible protein DinB
LSAHLKRMLRYDIWANEATLGSLSRGPLPPRSLRWMSHIFAAELLWLSRMEGVSSKLPVWPQLTVEQCQALLPEISGELEDLEHLGPIDRPIGYTNSKGEAWSSTVGEILTHLVIHSAYHRGQIASDLRNAGQEPAYTDYIHAVRQGLIE